MTEAIIGEGVRIDGDVFAEKDLVVAGEVSGKIRSLHLTIRTGGSIDAEVEAERVIVQGRASGAILASDKIEVEASATVIGDLSAPSVVIEEGAIVFGSVRMVVDLPDDL